MTSHCTDEVEQLATKVAVLKEGGNLQFTGNLKQLSQKYTNGLKQYAISFLREPELGLKLLLKYPCPERKIEEISKNVFHLKTPDSIGKVYGFLLKYVQPIK